MSAWDDSPEIVRRLKTAVGAFDGPAAGTICDEVIARLWTTDEIFPAVDAKACLVALRSQRFFALMQRLAEAFIAAGHANTHQIRRQYAQALLDQGHMAAATCVLERLVTTTAGNPSENFEARGLRGRACKQLYVDGGSTSTTRSRLVLAEAVRCYADVYQQDANQLWHGINQVALLMRAERDGIPLADFPDPRFVASTILDRVGNLDAPTPWDYATAAEACVALDRRQDALRWIDRYLTEVRGNAFEIASTRRQFVEVWQLTVDEPMGQLILPPLRAALLQCQGGAVEWATAGGVAASAAATFKTGVGYEKVLGDTNVVSLRSYQLGLERCRAVARIEDVEELDDHGFGTGFLLRGDSLCDGLGERWFVLTNNHVVSATDQRALPLARARVSFKALGDEPIDVVPKSIVWSSPREELDATLLEVDPPAKEIEPYVLATYVPREDEGARVYVIGHPGGGGLSLSINDNRLLDHDDRRLHYRAPTEGGSSGSPVFNQRWQLLGLHHAGGTDVPRLNDKPGFYAANEGIWIQAIKAAPVRR